MSDQDELIAWVRSGFDAWNAHDVDRILDESGGAGGGLGFGFRTRDARVGGTVEDERQRLTFWFGTLDRYRIEDAEVSCFVDDDIAKVWGFFTEDFAHTRQDPERVRVRYSMVLRRLDDGWQSVWNHRDIQRFAEDGSYLREPAPDA